MKIGKYEFDLDKEPVIMGILNITPDSFSDGGKWNSLDKALEHTRQMIDDGAKIIDIGGEATRPGYTLISDEEEISRVVPVIEAVKERFDVSIWDVLCLSSGVCLVVHWHGSVHWEARNGAVR